MLLSFLRIKAKKLIALLKFRTPFILNKKYKIFTFCIIAIAIFCSSLAMYYSYQGQIIAEDKKNQAIAESAVNNLETFFENIRKQVEFIGYKIKKNPHKTELIQNLIESNFSLGFDLDTSRVDNWILLNWNSPKENFLTKKHQFLNTYTKLNSNHLIPVNKPWEIQLEDIHSLGKDNQYIPLHFGITDRNNNYLGHLSGNIYIDSIIKHLKSDRNLENKSLAILDKNKLIIYQDHKFLSLSPDIFQKDLQQVMQIDEGNINAYSKDSLKFPYHIVVLSDRSLLIESLNSLIIKYLLFTIFITLLVLIIFECLCKSIINPISVLGNYANKIINNKTFSSTELEKKIEKVYLDEFVSLKKALIKINSLKQGLKRSNNRLSSSLENIESINLKLTNSYRKRFKYETEYVNKKLRSIDDLIEEAISILYPEIYLKDVKIEKKVSCKNVDLSRKELSVLTKIIIFILQRSTHFCLAKSTTKIVAKQEGGISKQKNLVIEILDEGIADESWRDENSSYSFKDIEVLFNSIGASYSHSNLKERGVRYTVNVPLNKASRNVDQTNGKVITLFPR